MSKIGEKTITVPSNIQVDIKDQEVSIKGNNGQINIKLTGAIKVEKLDDKIVVTRKKEDKKSRSLHGLYRSLIANAVTGLEKPWEKRLEIVGTGYNVKLQGEDLVFKVGYSHPIEFKKIDGIKFSVDGNNKVLISGFDKYLVGQVAHEIKLIKKPDAYKGKGIRYEGEKLRLKPGKKAKTAGAE